MVVSAVAAALAWPAPAPAQEPAAGRERSRAEFPVAARAVSRIAMLDLWRVPTLAARDYRIAALAMEIAADLDPADEDLLRRLIEAEDAAGRTDLVLRYTERLVRLSPADTVAQLRLITSHLAALQNVDRRLAAYDALLGPRGAALDASIRSRLALDSALLLRERGDAAAFAARLSQAIALDPTNKEAAAAAVLHHAERSDDRSERVDLLLVLLKADPMDPETYLSLARELASGGAYRASRRMYRCMEELVGVLGQPADAGVIGESLVVRWAAEGARKIIDPFKDQVDTQRGRVRERAEQLRKLPGYAGVIPDPDEIYFDIPTARILLAAASGLGDEALTDWAAQELALSVRKATSALDLRVGGSGPVRAEMTEEDRAREQADLAWMRLWTGRQVEEAAAHVRSLRTDPRVGSAALQRLEAWLLLRSGEVEAGARALERLAPTDPLAELGLGVAKELAGDAAGAAAEYTAYWHRWAGTMAGVWAKSRAARLLGDDPPQPAGAERVETLIADIPSWLEEFSSKAATFASLQADVLDMPHEAPFPVEAYPIRIRLRNTSPIPLAVGAERPLNSRFILCPTIWIGRDRVDDSTTMEVVSLARRLRLMPQEALEVTVLADNGWMWRRLATLGNREVRMRWRVVQGFRMTTDRIVVAGPLCRSAETSVIGRAVPPMAGAPVAAVRRAIEGGTAAEAVQAIGDTLYRWRAPAEQDGFQEADGAAIARAIAARYPTLDVSGRLILLALLPVPSVVPALAPAEEVIRQERDPAALALVLLTRVTDAADPLLEVAGQDGGAGDSAASARLAELAGLLKGRLAEGITGYAGLIRAPAEQGPAKSAGKP